MQTQEREGGDVSLLAIQPLIAVHSTSREATFKFQPTIGAHCVAEHNSATKERERDVSHIGIQPAASSAMQGGFLKYVQPTIGRCSTLHSWQTCILSDI